MFCIQRLKYIALFLLLALIIFGCGKDPDDPIFDNPFDPKNPKTNGEPYHLQVAVGDKNVVNLKWNQIDKVKKFSVYRSSSIDNEYKIIGISTSTEYIDSNIDANITYNYKIRAYWNGTEASPSGIVSIMPLIVYTITAAVENGGSISPSGSVKVSNGLSQSFNISPSVGYSILDVKIDGVSKGNISSYIFSNVITDHTIKASFSTNTFTITTAAESGGSISPSGNIKVAHGLSQTFSISPNAGYSILDVKVDGVSKGNISSYIFSNVTTDHTIKASFSANTYTVTATAENGGSVSPSGNVKVTYVLSQTFNISPNVGYSILDVKVDGVSKGNISSYTFSNVTTDHAINASFSTSTFTITATAESDGSISPSGNIKVTYGSSQTFNIYPNAGYSIFDVQIDGESIGKVNRYTFDNTTADHQIKAMIRKLPDITGKDGAPMVLVPAGEFQMGDSFNEGEPDELPVHTVYLDAFYIDMYEVTNAQYKNFMDATGHKAPTYWNDSKFNAQNNPVVGVSWNDANAYTDWAGKRLPTEAEWEKSARGGLVGKRYPWGDTITHDDANYRLTSGKDVWQYTSPVGSFAPNGYGLYDVAGNALEWCADWYDINYYAGSPKSNPTGPSSGSDRVLRGGSWAYDEVDRFRVSYRISAVPAAYVDLDVGFRCVQDITK